MRGVAVAAVFVHHARPDWLPGGWLGVDVFFVLSGYLITSLLVARGGGVRDFWARRLRRLVPPLLPVLGALAVAASLASGTGALRYRGLRADGLASLASVANWRFVATGDAYFDRFADPSLVRHLWSLSVEGQFYLVWPLVLAVLLRRGRGAAGAAALGLACVSVVAMVLVADADRAYYGTDTHAHGLLLGAAAALLGWRFPAAAGWAALGGLGVAFATVERIDLIPVAVVASVVVVASRDVRVLELAPLRALGRISYGVYLWHWPVLLVLDDLALVLQAALTLGLGIVSWVLVERPVLSGRVPLVAAPAAIAATAAVLAVLAVPVAAPQAAADAAARERNVETVAPADTDAPVEGRVLVVGDSVAYTLFPGLRAHEHDHGLEFVTAAESGCPLDVDAEAFADDRGEVDLELPSYCDWPRTWPGVVDRARPEIVVALFGLWDTFDHRVGGEWLRAGSTEWTHHMERVLDRAVDVLGARGAHVVVLTTPPLPGDARRTQALDAVYAAVAERRPGALTVVDIEPALREPGAQRWDAVHFTEAGATAAARAVVPELARIARTVPPRVGVHGG